MPMNSESTSGTGKLIVRSLLFLVGALVAGYALSDHPLYGGEPGFGRFQMLLVVAGGALALCGLLPTAIAGRVLLLSVASLVMLAFAEMAGEILLGPRYRPIFQPDERLIFKFIPNRYSVMNRAPINGGGTVGHRINSAGFRGDELLPAGNAARVVVYGDSFIHAFYSHDEETFAAQLGARLAGRAGRRVEVVNAGVSSYGPDQIILKMEQELPRLRPDLAIVAIFAGNDYGDLLRNKIYRLGADGALAENSWKLDPKVRMWLELSQRESILKRAVRSALGAWGSSPDRDQGERKAGGPERDVTSMEFLLEEAEREYRNYVLERNDAVTNTHVDYYSADVSLTPGSASARYKVALMQAVVRGIRDVAARNNVALALLLIPHPFDVAEHYGGWSKVDRGRFPDYNGRNQVAPLEDMARALGVPFVSLYDVYRANDANKLYFHGGDDHWNAAGQRLAAEVMADYLIARDLSGAGKAAEGAPRHEKTKQ